MRFFFSRFFLKNSDKLLKASRGIKIKAIRLLKPLKKNGGFLLSKNSLKFKRFFFSFISAAYS